MICLIPDFQSFLILEQPLNIGRNPIEMLETLQFLVAEKHKISLLFPFSIQ